MDNNQSSIIYQIVITNPNVNLYEYLSKKDKLTVYFTKHILQEIFIEAKSILKIFSLISNDENDTQIHCSSLVKYRANQQLNNISNIEYELDPTYKELLHKSKSYFVTPNKSAKSIMITDFSLKNITKFMQKDIIAISDYISVAIFIFNNEELHARQQSLNRLSLRANILERYGRPRNITTFNGVTSFEDDIPIAIQNHKINFHDYEYLFSNTSAFLQQKEQIPTKTNRSFKHFNYDDVSNSGRLLLSRQRLSKGRIQSPYFSPLNQSFNENVIDFSEADPERVQKFRGAPPKNRAVKLGNNEKVNVYLLRDVDKDPIFVDEDLFNGLCNAKEEKKIGPDKAVSIFNNKDNKIVQIDYGTFENAKDNEDNKMVKMRDMKGKTVVVPKKKLEEVAEEKKEDVFEIDDYEGRKVVVQYQKGEEFKKAEGKAKKFYCIRLARIELSDVYQEEK